MRISDWSSDVCSSDLAGERGEGEATGHSGLLFGRATNANDSHMQEIKGTLRGTFANFRHMARNSRHRARTPAIRSPMREKELRFALICYGGISLAVYMHGITKEVWRLSAASRAFHDEIGRAHV